MELKELIDSPLKFLMDIALRVANFILSWGMYVYNGTANLLDNTYTYTCALELSGVSCTAWLGHYSRHCFSFVQICVFLCNLE